MEKYKPEQESSSLNLLREAIDSSVGKIEAELARADNSWISCFSTRVQVIDTFLFIAKEKGELTEEAYKKYENKILDVKKRVKELTSSSRATSSDLSEEEKKKLIDSLDILN